MRMQRMRLASISAKSWSKAVSLGPSIARSLMPHVLRFRRAAVAAPAPLRPQGKQNLAIGESLLGALVNGRPFESKISRPDLRARNEVRALNKAAGRNHMDHACATRGISPWHNSDKQ